MKTTRDQLIAAAARELERHGYHGTDTNKIARAAGFAPATFYKHFLDKRAVFLAVHAAWVDKEWDTIEALRTPAEIVDFVLAHHRRWRTFRASLKALIATDATVRRFHRAARRRQLARMPRPDAILLLEVERIADAVADGELAALGVSPAAARRHLIQSISRIPRKKLPQKLRDGITLVSTGAGAARRA